MKQVEDTGFYSKKIGSLAKGCQMCVRGEKLVLYITGICPRKCWYCPLSEQRKDKDVIFLNERKSDLKEDLIDEIKLCQSKGAGITGGDPLSRLSRTCEYVSLMKKEFGKDFHVHLYTSFDLVSEESLRRLYYCGVDEIRFHADLDSDKLWDRIDIANLFDWDVGIEIPCEPDKLSMIENLCDFMNGKIKFMNLNEFEISDLNSEEMYNHGFEEKSDISHGILGSEEVGMKVMEYVLNLRGDGDGFSVHFCTGTLKDRVQMQNRFKLRAEMVANDFDIISEEGLLVRGCIYLKDKEKNLNRLREVLVELEDEGLEAILDEKKFRILCYPEHVEQFADVLKELGLVPAIVEEDPTDDAQEMNISLL